jgi:hypothetical protein
VTKYFFIPDILVILNKLIKNGTSANESYGKARRKEANQYGVAKRNDKCVEQLDNDAPNG